jgi:uncharacterized membrane protein
MTRLLRLIRVAALALGGAAYLGVAFAAAAMERPPLLLVILGMLPLAALAVAASWASRARHVALAACVIALVLVVRNLQALQEHVAFFYFVQHVGAMGALAVTFGATLWAGPERALCSRIAAFVMPGARDAQYMLYTWKVTLAWTVFFALTAAVSIVLFFWGPLVWWSFFANVLSPVLVGAMFAAEYAIRLVALPQRPHLNVAETIQAYRAFRRG